MREQQTPAQAPGVVDEGPGPWADGGSAARRRSLLLTSAGVAAGLVVMTRPVPVRAAQPLRIVVGYPPGGASDRAARLVAEGLQARTGSSVVVENKTGAGGRLAAQLVKATPADQPTLMIGNPAVMVVAPLVYKDAGYDAQRDFVPVSQVSDYDFAVAVGAAVPVREVSHLVAWLRANPKLANFGVPATGSLPHFFALMLARRAAVEPQIIGYRGSAPLATDLIGGQVPVAIDTLDTLVSLHEGGKLKILASSGASRSELSPAVPTLKESGIDVVATGWNTLFAPASMPAAEVERWSKAVRDVMREPSTRKAFSAAKMTPVAADAAETAAGLKRYRAQWEPIIRESGFEG